jgi:hypothetical protein
MVMDRGQHANPPRFEFQSLDGIFQVVEPVLFEPFAQGSERLVNNPQQVW